MRFLITAVLIVLSHLSLAIKLSESSKITIMTIGPGQNEVYSAFGHSAIRVNDPGLGIDDVYNYGIFDFDQPNFYLNFTKGRLLYQLGKSDYKRTVQYYAHYNRSIKEQTLNLTLSQRQDLLDFLEENYKPENREYYYNYIYDNCATKIQDVIDAVFPQRVRYDYSFDTKELSYRQLMDLYLDQQPWGDLGIDICLGMEIDAIAPAKGYLFLPDYVFMAFQGAKMELDSIEVPLVQESATVYQSEPQESAASSVTPVIVFTVLFFVGGLLSHRELKYGIWYRWFDVSLLLLVGTVGCLLLLLWVATDHLSQYNLNLAWAVPLNVPMIVMLLKLKGRSWVRNYFLTVGVIQVALIVCWGFLPQQLHTSLLPLILLLAVRNLLIWWKHSIKS